MTTGFDEASVDLTGGGLDSRYAAIGGDDPESSGGSWNDLGGDMPTVNYYSKSNFPKFTSNRGDINPYYFNGPRRDPWERGQSELAQATALSGVYANPEKRPTIERFGRLFNQYGQTNSPGVLWALAQTGDTWTTDQIQGVLELDARAVQRGLSQNTPVIPGSPNGQRQAEQDSGSLWESVWAGPQFLARNAFSLLSAPMEAIQGGVRTAGGALTQTGSPDALKATLGIGSIIPGIGLIGDAIYGDDNFQDAWEQTDAGQQAIGALTGMGFSAFTSGTAGIDYEAARIELDSNPEYAGYRALVLEDPTRSGEILTKIGEEQGLYSNPGWFIEENSQVGEAQRQSTFESWSIPYGPVDPITHEQNMTSWTLGRGITGKVLPPGHTASMGLSGLIDAAAAIFGDPTIIGSKFGVGSKLARSAGILIDESMNPVKAVATATNDARALGRAETALTFGREKKRLLAGVQQRNAATNMARELYNRTHPDEAPITAAVWSQMTPEEQLVKTRVAQEADAAEKAARSVTVNERGIRATARDVRRAESMQDRAAAAGATAPFANDVESIPKQVGLWEGMMNGSRLTKPRPETAPVAREWMPIEQPPAATAPAAPRDLTIQGEGTAWDVVWEGQILGTSTSKRGAQAMRKRILAKDAEDAKFDEALASGRTAPAEAAPVEDVKWRKRGNTHTADGWKIAVADDGRAVLTDTTGAKVDRTFATVDQAKAAVARDRAATPAPAEPQMAAYSYGDITVRQHPEGHWTVEQESTGRKWKMKTQAIAQKWAEKKAAEADDVPMTVYSARKFDAWYATLTPEEQALWNDSVAHFNLLAKQGKLEGIDWSGPHALEDSINAFIRYLHQQGQAAIAAPATGGKYAGDAHRAAVELIIDNRAGTEMFQNVDNAGVTLAEVPQPGIFQRGIHDGADVVTAWAGDVEPVLLKADDALDPELGKVVFAQFEALLERRPSLAVQVTDAESVTGQVATKINQITDPMPLLKAILTTPGSTVREMFRTVSAMGLDGYLDDFLRQAGFDGIDGVNAAERGGVWMGDHPKMESYLWPETAVDDAARYGEIPDEAEMEQFLSSLPQAVPFGMHQSNLMSLSQFMALSALDRSKAAARHMSAAQSALVQASAADVRLADTLDEIATRYSDPMEALRTILRYDAGMGHDFMNGAMVDADKAAWFLSGNGLTQKFVDRSLEALARFLPDDVRTTLRGLEVDSDDWNKAAEPWIGQLILLSGKEWEPATARAVLMNDINGGGKAGLVEALAPRFGLDANIGTVPKLVSNKDGGQALRSLRTPSSAATRFVQRMVGERPNLQPVELANSRNVIDAITKYMVYAKVPSEEIARMVGRVALADGSLAVSERNTQALFDSFDIIGKSLAKDLAERTTIFKGKKGEERLAQLQQKIESSTRLTYAGVTDLQRSTALRMGHGPEQVLDDTGRAVDLPPLILDSELMRGHMMLPSVEQWSAAVSTMGAVLNRFEWSEKAWRWAADLYDNLFRTSLLVLRGSYLLRNPGEMQFRVYLNGHESAFSDPMSMFAMTVLQPHLAGRNSKWADLFEGKYADTVLGDGFVVPKDLEAATADQMEEYFGLIRDSHSLGDPRVNRSGAVSKFEMVGADSPHFTDGWANELITMHNSLPMKIVLGQLPQNFRLEGQFGNLREAAVKFILSDHPLAVAYRQKMEASDDAWKTLFSSERMVEEFLFDSPNSVFNRMHQFTMGDPILTDFIRTGEFRGGGLDPWKLRGSDLRERIRGLSHRLKQTYMTDAESRLRTQQHFEQNNVFVPFIDSAALQQSGLGVYDKFFDFANFIDRNGVMAPEFRMAYWDEMALLIPLMDRAGVDEALKSARTTLSGLKRVTADGTLERIGRTHPAFEAAKRAKAEGVDSLMTIEEAHAIASAAALRKTRELFYDASRRNTFWTAMRLIFPFGQAWGNTLMKWGELGAKKPIQVYKVQKAFNALQEAGSQAAYDYMSQAGLLNDYADGYAPWDADPSGGFLFSDGYGNQRFMVPWQRPFGALADVISGNPGDRTPMLDTSSTTSSLNVALGSESIIPGTSAFAAVGFGMLPDGPIADGLQNLVNPFGANSITDAIPQWVQYGAAGLAEVPLIGEFAGFLSPFSEGVKNKNMVEAAAYLATTGTYDVNDSLSVQRLRDDTAALGTSWALIDSVGKNLSPVSPTMEGAIRDKNGQLIALSVISQVYQMDLENNGGDSYAAKADVMQRYGIGTIFALTGNRKGLNTIPSDEALDWARANPENMALFRANPEEVAMFFQKGDPSNLTARALMERLTGREIEYKTAQDIVGDVVGTLQQVERNGVDTQLKKGVINAEQASAAKKAISDRYNLTSPGTSFSSRTGTEQVEGIREVYGMSPSLQNTPNGVSFATAWDLRGQALAQARSLQNDPSATLKGKNVATLKAAYFADLDELTAQNPAFAPLMLALKREFD